jgi:2-oxoglutarate dehydrogenase E2 component (dihydrolipoamide succinyltransferase)
MANIVVPSPGESITEVQIATWLVEDGQQIEKNQDVVEIDSDKATLTVATEESGKIKILANEGDIVKVGTVIATIDANTKGIVVKKENEPVTSNMEKTEEKSEKIESIEAVTKENDDKKNETINLTVSPLARKLMNSKKISEGEIIDFFKTYRISRKDIEFYLDEKENPSLKKQNIIHELKHFLNGTREVERKKMTMLRRKLSERLVSVKNETAMLTTFNEVNMTPIFEIRKKYKDIFKEHHGIGLGFMSFFTKAVTEAIAHFPSVNSQINGDEIVSFKYADIGIAVSAPKGLVVPVIRNAESLTLAEIEKEVKRLAVKARENKITIQDMEGGTFTITNGGVFGSMVSTPIINPPQSAILGMHNIVERPVAIAGKVEIHPIMYVALSYDHRLIDGRESVGFLVKVKELLENPVKLLFSGKEPEEILLGLQ